MVNYLIFGSFTENYLAGTLGNNQFFTEDVAAGGLVRNTPLTNLYNPQQITDHDFCCNLTVITNGTKCGLFFPPSGLVNIFPIFVVEIKN